ncbi:hypothetical protein [Desulfospira joergensenii]|uniref:hypothetical protein n=1 Tax=Desulfospira joergensenii TaxID=53329 RepID=UPI0003B540DE|nr:hypothetical protein [Desulfospira joergensenii]
MRCFNFGEKWRKIQDSIKKNTAIYAIAFLFILIVLIGNLDLSIDKTIYSLFGVVLGSLITSFTTISSSTQNREHQLRLAAIDKRLEVHQKAYSIWTQMRKKYHNSDQMDSFKNDFQQFWDNNCLYLAPKARKAIWDGYHDALECSFLIEERSTIKGDVSRTREINDRLFENSKKIKLVGEAITNGVELPAINEELELPGENVEASQK